MTETELLREGLEAEVGKPEAEVELIGHGDSLERSGAWRGESRTS